MYVVSKARPWTSSFLLVELMYNCTMEIPNNILISKPMAAQLSLVQREAARRSQYFVVRFYNGKKQIYSML